MSTYRWRRLLGVAVLLALAACAPAVPGTAGTASARPTPSAHGATAVTSESRFVDSVLALMTVDEKLGQLNQLSGLGEPTGPGGAPAGLDEIRRGEVGSFLNIVGADTTRALQRIAVEQSRLHIPLLFAYDVIHGYRTIFPVPLASASSWDPAVVEHAARIAATEAAAHGIDWTFAPMVDIARDPRWGRIVEGYGEDPYLGSALAAAAVRGFQGSDLRAPDAIAATAKHFAAYGAAEGGRDYNVAEVSERTLRDVYLPPFHAAVCAGTATLMASFNEIAGVPSHANRALIDGILRGEWGFDGLVVSDWTGINELLNHGVAATRADAGRLALDAGVDVDMVSEIYRRDLGALVRSGAVAPARLDAAVRRVLRLKYRLGLFGNPYLRHDAAREAAVTLTLANRAAARQAARESIVLLRNEGSVLPLRKDLGTIAVIGPLAADSGAMIGNWQAQGRAADAVPVLDGVRLAVSPSTTVLYARGAGVRDADTTGFAAAVAAARRADAVVLVIGETPDMSAEASSRASLDLPGVQQQLAAAVVRAGKPVVVVLMNGRPLAIDWLHDHVPAIVESWFPGVEGGTAVADILFGDVNPSGKLPVTFPRSVGQVPIYYAHKNTGRPPAAAEKYTSKYIDLPWTPLYPFGFGLSYTTFSYGAPRLSGTVLRPGDSLDVAVDVANRGPRAGDEIVQLYVRDEVGSVTRPVEQLRGFRRVSLRPGEEATVHFTLGMDDLAFHDTAMARVAEPGAFRVRIGPSSDRWQETSFRLETPDGRPAPVAERCGRR
ncbi:MAG TPA: glycoside hydrolase family 3 N-terminal domain-containing protein [Gemmatimonadaceae bacterium]|nr:glycoside hydrolase family 3 N-terminal domain-containing protein [Gemmatimonadaceae bacterium]